MDNSQFKPTKVAGIAYLSPIDVKIKDDAFNASLEQGRVIRLDQLNKLTTMLEETEAYPYIAGTLGVMLMQPAMHAGPAHRYYHFAFSSSLNASSYKVSAIEIAITSAQMFHDSQYVVDASSLLEFVSRYRDAVTRKKDDSTVSNIPGFDGMVQPSWNPSFPISPGLFTPPPPYCQPPPGMWHPNYMGPLPGDRHFQRG